MEGGGEVGGGGEGDQRWRSGESARLPPVWPGFDSRTRCHMWVEFVVGSLLAPRGFSPGTPVFLPPPPRLPHQCGPASIPRPGVICGLSLLLVLSLLQEVFLRVLRSSSHPLPPSPTSVAWVRFPDPASYMGWICCWFSPCSKRFFSGNSDFPLCSKTNISKFQFYPYSKGNRFNSRWTVKSQPLINFVSV